MIKFNLYPCTHFIKDLPDFDGTDGTVSVTNLETGEEMRLDDKPGWIEAWMPSAPSKDAKPWYPRDLGDVVHFDPEDDSTFEIDEQGRVSGMGKKF